MIKKVSIFLTVFLLFGFCLSAQNVSVDEQLAAQYFHTGEYEKSAEIYERLFAKTSNRVYYTYLLRSYENLKDYKKAEKLVQRQIKSYPEMLSFYVDLGALYSQMDEKSKAEKQYTKAIDNLKAGEVQIQELAQSFKERKLPDYAIATYQKGRTLLKDPLHFIFDLIPLYSDKGMYDELVIECLDLLVAAPDYTEQVQVYLQNILVNDASGKFANTLKSQLVKHLQKSPENLTYANMLIWYAFQEKDFAFAFLQAKAIDKRSSKDAGSQVFRVAMISASNKDYDVAKEAYDYLVKKGKENPYYMESRIGFLNAEFEKALSGFVLSPLEYQQLKDKYKKTLEELGKNANTIPLMRDLAHLLAFYGNDMQEATDILYEAIEIPADRMVTADCKLELGDILLFADDVWEASLLYSQVEKAFKNDALGASAKFKNAELSYYIGDFDWAKSQLNVLRASTSKLIANDAMELSLLISDNMDEDSSYTALEYYSKADLLFYRNQYEKSLVYLDSAVNHTYNLAIGDEVLMKEAQIRLKQGKYEKADTLLQEILLRYPNDILADDAIFMLGKLYEEQFKNVKVANSYYEKLILDYPASLYVVEARKRYKATLTNSTN